MSILTGTEIKIAIKNGDIKITNHKDDAIGTESIDLHLDFDMLEVVPNNGTFMDPKLPQVTRELFLHEVGQSTELYYILFPGKLYLASTIEGVGSEVYHCELHDKSSCARMGVSTHKHSGFGDTGFYASWTLEIKVDYPTKLYVGMAICQMSFETLQGERTMYYDRKSSKYHNQKGPTASKIHENFK
jgi:dCTP deaminase